MASCVVTLHLYGVHSLKDKRRVVKSLLARLPRRFNVAVAEVNAGDSWSQAVLGLVTVGREAAPLHATLEKAVAWIESDHTGAAVERYSIEQL
ncbi:MAG: DUF503 domain-containing protein [Candidatus Promineifilaceae bacterium]